MGSGGHIQSQGFGPSAQGHSMGSMGGGGVNQPQGSGGSTGSVGSMGGSLQELANQMNQRTLNSQQTAAMAMASHRGVPVSHGAAAFLPSANSAPPLYPIYEPAHSQSNGPHSLAGGSISGSVSGQLDRESQQQGTKAVVERSKLSLGKRLGRLLSGKG